jgi:hypothetical protein
VISEIECYLIRGWFKDCQTKDLPGDSRPERLLRGIRMKIQRVYSDSDGESHFVEIDVKMSAVDFAPPAPPPDLSEFLAATRVAIMRAPPGWKGDWHPAPCRQLMFYLSGQVEAETSDGEQRTMGPGRVVLVEDTTGFGEGC